jgi:WD40 repeat protein
MLLALLLAAVPQIAFQSSHLSSPEEFALSPDGHLLAAWVNTEPRARVWDLDTFQLAWVFANETASGVFFSADGKVLQVWDKRYDLTTGAPVAATVELAKAVQKPANSPLKDPQAWGYGAGGKLLLGASNEEIVVMDPATLAIKKRIPAPPPGATARLSRVPLLPQVPVAQRAAFVIVQGQIVHIDPVSLAPSRPVAILEEHAIPEVLIVRPDGNIAITVHDSAGLVYDNETFTAFDAWTGAQLFRFGGSQSDPPDVRFNSEGHLVWASAGIRNGSVELLEGQVTRVFDIGAARELLSEPVMFGQLSPDARFMVQNGVNGPLQLRSLTTGAVQSVTAIGKDRQAPFSYPKDGRWSRDGRMFAGRVEKGYIIWDTVKAASPLALTDVDVHEYEGPLFSPDDSLLAVNFKAPGYYGNERSYRVYDLANGKIVSEGKGIPLAFSRDGQQLALSATYQEPSGEVMDVHTGAALTPLFKKSPGEDFGDVFALASRFEIDVWNQDTNIYLRRRKLARSPDGATIALSDAEGGLTLLDSASQKVRKQASAHQGALVAMRFSADSKRLLTYGSDRQTQLWDALTGEKIASFIATGEPYTTPQELLAFTPEGYYFGQRAAVKMLAVNSGSRMFPIGQFDAWLNRPDIVLARLGGADKETIEFYQLAHERRLRKLGVSATAPQLTLPAVRVHREKLRAAVKERHLSLEVEALANGAPVAGLQVVANGVPLFGPKGTPPVQRLEIELANGDNRLEVTALDQLGRESTPEIVVVKFEAPAVKPDLYVLAVGVSKYAQADYGLQYAAKDAQDLLEGLGGAKGVKMMYGKLHLRAVVDAEATREKVAAAAKELFSPAQIDDRLVLFFAGHGLLDARAGYFFATTDLDFENPADRGLSFDAMEELFAGMSARHRLMLVDTCAAGETDEDEVARAKDPRLTPGVLVASRGIRRKGAPQLTSVKSQLLLTRELFAGLRRGSGASVIGSSSGVEYALESAELKNGVFTASLLETLHGFLGKEGVSLMEEMTPQYIQLAVSKKVLAKTAGQQHPVARETNLDDPFTVWRTTDYISYDKQQLLQRKKAAKKK